MACHYGSDSLWISKIILLICKLKDSSFEFKLLRIFSHKILKFKFPREILKSKWLNIYWINIGARKRSFKICFIFSHRIIF